MEGEMDQEAMAAAHAAAAAAQAAQAAQAAAEQQAAQAAAAVQAAVQAQPLDLAAAVQALGAQMQSMMAAMQNMGHVLQQAAAAPQAAAEAAAAAQQAASIAAAAGQAAPAAEYAGRVGHSRLRSKYQMLALATDDGKEISGRLNMSLETWRTATELSHTLNDVPPHLWVQAAIANAMSGHVQSVALQMLQSALLPDWGHLLEQLRTSFEPHEQKRIAANALEQLRMKDGSVAALETFVARSRELHMLAGELVTPERRWSYFMRGMPAEYSTLLTTVMEATNQPHTFESASQLALKSLANRLQQPAASGSGGAAPMELAAMGQKAWQRGSQQRGNQQRGGKQSLGKAGGSRQGRDEKRKGAVPKGPWRPQLSQKTRKSLMDQGKCLCCKQSAEHGWRDCPQNPDNRQGNA